MTWWIGLGILVCFVFIAWRTDDGEAAFGFLFISAILWFLIWLWMINYDPQTIAEREARQQAEQAKELAERTPHVIREADGCKVYAFKAGDRFHYFTRCKDTSVVTTESSRQVTCGKNCTKIETETIETR